MTDMQRYSVNDDGFQTADERGPFVLYSDAEAAIAAAEAAGYHDCMVEHGIGIVDRDFYQQGQRDMLAKCIAAVEAVHSPIPIDEHLSYCRGCADAAYEEYSYAWPCAVVTALRALQSAVVTALRALQTP